MPGTIGQGLSFKIYQPGIPFHFQFPDWIEPNVGAVSCFRYENQKGAGVYFEGEHRVLNLGFGFEAVDSHQWDDPKRYSRRRMEFMQRVFQFLGPLRHKPITDAENDTAAAVMFRAEFAPLVEKTDSLYLFYRRDLSQPFLREPLYVSDSGVGALVVHFEDFSGEVEYYFQLKDPYFTFSLPINAPEETFSFRLGADTEKPKIGHIPPPDLIAQNKPRKITVSVTDNLGVDPSSVKMYFSTGFFSDSLMMTPVGEDLFVAEIPPPGVIADSVVYFFTASDLAKNPNRAKSEYFSYFIGRENFELGLDYWQPDTICWKLDDRESRSPMFCIATFPGGGYQKNTNASIYLIPGISVRALKNVELIFWTKYEIEQGHDFGVVEAKLGSANLWQQMGDAFSGKVDNWEKIEISLNSFFADTDDSLFLRFRFQSDSLQEKPMAGWFIDDVEFQKTAVTKVLPPKISASSISKIFDLSPNFPNPFNSVTRVKFRIGESAKVRAQILNVKGQIVREIDMGFRDTGMYDFLWDGTNGLGERCTTGVYFFSLMIEKMSEERPERLKKTVKMILLR